MSLIPKKHLDFWIENKLNVLIEGHAGVGKTHTILEAFAKHNLRYQYYSCSTLDPWISFLGVPREIDDPDTGRKVLDMVIPKQWAKDEIDVLFLDEYNRSKTAVRNAVMELIQFKSINGRKFNNLKMVWCAINPDSTEDENISYDVEPLDPAQKDRFHIHYEVPYEPDMEYFSKKFGQTSAKLAIEWWKSLEKSIRMSVSPRRLDYAMEVYNLGGSINFVLPKVSNPMSLEKRLGSMSIVEKITSFMEKSFTDTETIKTFFQDEKNYHFGLSYILENQKTWEKLLPCFPNEKLNSLVVMKENEKIIQYILSKEESFSNFFDEISKATKDSFLKKFVTDNIKHNKKSSESLKEKFGLDQKTVNKEIETSAVNDQKKFLNNAIKEVNGHRIQTPTKVRLIKKYIEKFCVSGFSIVKPREDEILALESKFLIRIAQRMHEYTFKKLFQEETNIPVFGRTKLNKFFAANIAVIAKAVPADITDHFTPIFNQT